MKNFVLLTFISFVLSGCFIGRAVKDFSVNVGKHLPVKGGVERCEDKMICPDESKPVARQKPPAPPSAAPVPSSKPTQKSDTPKTLKDNEDVPSWMKEEERVD